jgi:hypothetical protein
MCRIVQGLIDGWEENTSLGTGVPSFSKGRGVALLWYVTVCMLHGVVVRRTLKGGVTSM